MALQNIEANITLDLYDHDTTPSTVKAIQLDSQTRYVAAMLQSMGAQYDVDSGATVQLIVIRPDKVGVQIVGTTFTYGDEGASFLGPYAELTQVALAVNGKMRGQFKITSGTQILRTEIFTISNGEALDASTDEWADEYDGYNLEEMATSIETNTADIASLEADVSQIKEDLSDISDAVFNETLLSATTSASGWKLKDDGLCVRDDSYKMDKYPVTAGDTIKVVSDHLFQFQINSSVPSSGTSMRVGETYGTGTFRLTVPETATYLIVSTLLTDSQSAVYSSTNKEDFTDKLLSMSEMFKYYGDFMPYYITTSGGTIGMETRNHERYSGIVNLSKSIYLTMTNPLYVFRIYWYEGTTLHSTAWGDTWEIPSGVDVGVTIKHRNSTVLTDDERPQYYLIDTKLYTEPKSYYDAEIADTIEKVNAAITEPSLVFLLSADPHTMSVQGTLVKQDSITDMVVNMKRVAKEIQFDGHISLGDIADYKVPTSTVAANYGITDLSMDNLDDVFMHWMTYAMEQLKSVPADLIYVLGNHDDNRYINRDNLHESVSAYDYTKGEMYSYYIAKGKHNRVGNNDNNGLDYYIDYPEHKVRLIAINSNVYDDTTKAWWYGYDDSTVTWLTNALSGMPTGYGALLLTHLSPVRSHNEDTSAYKNRDNIANVIQTFVSGGGNYIATLYGHSHVDWASTSPWLEICFAAAKCQNLTPPSNMSGAVAPTRTAGTYTEDCWSVVVVQPISRKIKIIRFGAGDDREYTY